MSRLINPYIKAQEEARERARKKPAGRAMLDSVRVWGMSMKEYIRGTSMKEYIRGMNMKKVLLVAVAVNFVFLGAYLSMSTLSASAADEKTAQAAPRKDPVQGQDVRAQLDSLRQREELLRVRQRELQLLESRIDEKIRRLTELETNVKAEIAMYKGISDERTKHLVKIYSSMKPVAAANLMNQMDIEVATEVFLSMKGEIAGGILASMEPAKAAAISKRLMSTRKMSPSTSQALPQPSPMGQANDTPAMAMTEPGAEPGTAMGPASFPTASPAPKAKYRKKAWAKAKPWASPAQVAQAAPQAQPQTASPQAAPTAAGQAPALQPLPLAKPTPQPQTAAKPTAPAAAPLSAPQASAAPAASKTAPQALAQAVVGQAEQK